jgi:hypothetical protein
MKVVQFNSVIELQVQAKLLLVVSDNAKYFNTF